MVQFAYSKEGQALNILPMVGMNSRARTPLFNEKRVAEHKASGQRYHQLTAQTTYEAMLRNQRLPGGPDSIHYPDSFRGDEGQAFFKSFTAIKRVSNTKTGRSWYEDKPGNEVVDCYVYGFAAHHEDLDRIRPRRTGEGLPERRRVRLVAAPGPAARFLFDDVPAGRHRLRGRGRHHRPDLV